MRDQQLSERLKRGDTRSFRSFYRQTQPKLSRWVEARVADRRDAEEVIQDTYLAFLDSLPLFRGESSLGTFLVSIARHEVADYWRRKYAKKAIKTVPLLSELYVETLYSSVVTACVIERVFSRLLPREVVILRLKYEEGLSLVKIARRLGITVKAAESRLFRARKAFVLVYGDVVAD